MKIHFIGIGGVSMSALAKYLSNKNFDISGSDKTFFDKSDELLEFGIKLYYCHSEENLKQVELVIYNSAISDDNVELCYAKQNKIPCISRSELLKIISYNFDITIGISGSHGKTTITSLISHILNISNLKFTAHIGGYDKVFGNLIAKGDKIFLSEVCEFKHNIDNFTSKIALVHNIDNDHMNCYKDLSDLKNTFFNFLDRADTRVINIDDKLLKDYNKDKITYGLYNGDYHIKNLKMVNDLNQFTIYEYNQPLIEVETKLPGIYSIYNILAGVSVARILGVSKNEILSGIYEFSGVERRNEYIGSFYGLNFYADYAHHPTEIENFLDTYKNDKDICVIFQPHTYSRTKILFNDFVKVLSKVENLILFKTYPAREDFDYEGSAQKLHQNIKKSAYFDSYEDLIKYIKSNAKRYSKVLIIGAGDLYYNFKINK